MYTHTYISLSIYIEREILSLKRLAADCSRPETVRVLSGSRTGPEMRQITANRNKTQSHTNLQKNITTILLR